MPMLSEDEILRYGEGAEAIFYDLERSIIDDIVRAIKKAGEITANGDYQIDTLRRLGLSDEEIRRRIQEALDATDEYMEKIFREAAEKTYNVSKDLYIGSGKPFVPAAENQLVDNLIQAARFQTMGEMKNLTQTIGFVMGGRFLPVYDYFIQTLDSAVGKIISGAFDYNTILNKTVSELIASGIRWVDYESGHHNRVTVAVRRAVMTGIRQMTQGITEQNAKDLDTQFFEVSAHVNARPDHAVWQGKVYSKRQLISVCGLGTGPGLLGWNCYHQYYPYVRGVSKRNYTDKQLKEWLRSSTKPSFEWKGKKITGYEGTQMMRKLETNMRAQRERIHLLKAGGSESKEVKQARVKYRVTMSQYKTLAQTLGLHTQLERVYIDGLGRV